MNDQSVKDDNVLIEALTRLSISHPREGFWKYYRQGVLDAHIFKTLDQVRDMTQLWMLDYNEHRRHDALNG